MRVRGNTCTKARCKRPGTEAGMCKSHLKQECDRLFSLIIRSRGGCESGRVNHAGNLQCAHGFSRRYLPTRWSTDNAWSLCAGCHTFFTARPLEWDDAMLEALGHERYWELRARALNTSLKPDLVAVYDSLVLQAREKGLA